MKKFDDVFLFEQLIETAGSEFELVGYAEPYGHLKNFDNMVIQYNDKLVVPVVKKGKEFFIIVADDDDDEKWLRQVSEDVCYIYATKSKNFRSGTYVEFSRRKWCLDGDTFFERLTISLLFVMVKFFSDRAKKK